MKYFLHISTLLFLVSCTSNTIYEKPKNLIPKDTMAALISDMIIAKTAKNQKNKNLEVKINYMPLVYNTFKIDSTRFTKSNMYYTSKIEIYEEIMLNVKERLTKLEEKYSSELKIKDSLERKNMKELKDEKIKEFSKDDKLIINEEFLKSKKLKKERKLVKTNDSLISPKTIKKEDLTKI